MGGDGMENIADGADPPTHPLYPLCRPVVWGRPVAQGGGKDLPAKVGAGQLISAVIIGTQAQPLGEGWLRADGVWQDSRCMNEQAGPNIDRSGCWLSLMRQHES